MMEQLSRHSLIDLTLRAQGDLHIDFHHTTEDTGYAVGEAVSRALGDRAGIVRYGSALIPMDETLTRVALDCSNRPYLVWKVNFSRSKLGEMDTELFQEWFRAFAQSAGLTLHVETLYGENNHHIVESCYKGLARALMAAISIDPRRLTLCRRPRAFSAVRFEMTLAIVDYGSGNLRSAAKGFEKFASEPVVVTSDPDVVARADRVVLPGQGAFADCHRGLSSLDGMIEPCHRRHGRAVPFFGICVGIQCWRAQEWNMAVGTVSTGFLVRWRLLLEERHSKFPGLERVDLAPRASSARRRNERRSCLLRAQLPLCRS